MLWKKNNQNGRWIQRLAERAALVITCRCNQDHHKFDSERIHTSGATEPDVGSSGLSGCFLTDVRASSLSHCGKKKNVRVEDESAGRSRECKTTAATRAPRTIVFAPPTNLPAVLHGEPSFVHSPGVLGEPQRVQLRTHQTENVPGSALQHHLYAQPAEPLRPADCCTGYGGRLVVTLVLFFICACE